MKVVCIGGGKGLSAVLKAWCQLGVEVTAIVATTDNGGSSGRLRNLGAPVAWGDLRKALIATCPCGNTAFEALSHRFSSLGNLSGHCTGNLMLEAIYQQTGSVTESVKMLGNMLGSNATVLPMCEESVDLMAISRDGSSIIGETQIDGLDNMPVHLMLTKQLSAPSACLDAISKADLICIGPGSLLTSVMPVLLMEDIQQALIDARKTALFIQNIAFEKGPASFINRPHTLAWIATHCPRLPINAELSRSHLVINQKRHRLPQALQMETDNDCTKHKVTSLISALHFAAEYLTTEPIPINSHNAVC